MVESECERALTMNVVGRAGVANGRYEWCLIACAMEYIYAPVGCSTPSFGRHDNLRPLPEPPPPSARRPWSYPFFFSSFFFFYFSLLPSPSQRPQTCSTPTSPTSPAHRA